MGRGETQNQHTGAGVKAQRRGRKGTAALQIIIIFFFKRQENGRKEKLSILFSIQTEHFYIVQSHKSTHATG